MSTASTAYWHIVLRCLTDLYGLPGHEARACLRGYRLRLNAIPDSFRRDLVYHLDPWALARRLAQRTGNEELSPEEAETYERIVREAEAEAAVLGTEQEVQSYSPAGSVGLLVG